MMTAADLNRPVLVVSIDHVRAILKAEKKEGRLACTGRGPKAKWRKV